MSPPLAPTVPSPCVRLCTLNEADVCVGCGRTLADITAWTRLDDDGKAACVAKGRARLQTMGRALPPYPPPSVLPTPRPRRG